MGKRLERAQSKALLSSSLAATGAAVGGPVGAGVGAITGLIIGDEGYVFPLDMVAIPAFEAFKIDGAPQFMIYIKQGETLVPTGGEVLDASPLTQDEQDSLRSMSEPKPTPKRRKTKYQRAYKKAFDHLAPTNKNKNGKWKKGGFKRTVKAAHAKVKKEMK